MSQLRDSSGNGFHLPWYDTTAGHVDYHQTGLVAGNDSIKLVGGITHGPVADGNFYDGSDPPPALDTLPVLAGDVWGCAWVDPIIGSSFGYDPFQLAGYWSPAFRVGVEFGSGGNIRIGATRALADAPTPGFESKHSTQFANPGPGTHFIFATYEEATHKWSFYLDGTLISTDTTATPGSTATVGTIVVVQGIDVDMLVDEVAFGYGSVPSAGDIAALYAAASTSFAAYNAALLAMNPLAYYHLDNDTTATPPVVTSVTPSSGPIAGGTSIVIAGTYFTGATDVQIDGSSVASFTVDSDSQITAITSPYFSGTFDTIVFTSDGASATSADDHFTYTDPETGVPGVVDVQFAWDDDTLEGDPTWFPVGTDVQAISTDRGKPADADLYEVGTASATLDEQDGSYNQLNASGPYFDQLTPYRQMRIVCADSSGLLRTLFRGHVNPRGWRDQPNLPDAGSTIVSASDPLALCAQCDLPTQPAAGAGDTAKSRLDAVMALAGFPDDAFFTWLATAGEVGATMGDTVYGGKLLAYLQQLALSDGGALWCDQNGRVTLEHRLNIFLAARRTTPQATFADDGSGVAFEKITPDYAHVIVNTARMAGISGNVQEVSDGTSISTLTGIANTVEYLDLLMRDDVDAAARAALLIAQYKDAWYGPVSLTFEVRESDDALDAALNLDVRDLISVGYTPPGLDATIGDRFIEKISHEIPVEKEPNTWKCTLELSAAARFTGIVGADFLQWDVGAWDEKKWSY